jgi:ATP/maltotriose-dependent transcriptional regulator MalT
LNLLAQGGSNQEISGQLNLSPSTVKQHLRTLFLRAGIRKENSDLASRLGGA